MRRRRVALAAAVAIAALAAAYSAYWFYVAGALESGIDGWVEIQRQNGVELAFSRDKIHGFPGDFRTNIQAPLVKMPVNGRVLTWIGADLALRMSPFDLHAVGFSAPGAHRLEGPDGNLYIQAEALQGRIEIGPDGLLSKLSAGLAKARLTLPNAVEIQASSARLAIALPAQPPARYPEPLVGFDLAAENLALPAGMRLLTADPLTRIAAAGAMLGPVPALPVDQAAAAWRDAGGVLDLKSFAFAKGPLAVTGSATLALDRNLQPEGAASLVGRGLAPSIDLLAGEGLIAPADALKFKAFVLGAQREGADGVPEVATGLTLQDGLLSWGPFPIARLPAIAW